MSDESEVDKVLARAGELRYLGKNRAFFAILFALWTSRKTGGPWAALTKLVLVASGLGGSFWYWG